MHAQTLLVSWRWNDLAEPSASALHICPVSEIANTRLVRIHQKLGREGIANWLKEDCTQNAKTAETEYVILLHSSGFAEEDARYIKASLADYRCNSAVHYFGSGNGFIYFSPSTNTGFLDHEGNFADKFDQDVCIRDEQGRLIHHYFRKVWRHYRYCAKRRLDNVFTHTIRFLNPSIESEGWFGTAFELLRQHHPDFLLEIESLLALLREHYSDEPEVQAHVENFTRLFSEKQLSSSEDLLEISEQFEALLAAIKEHDY